MATFFKNYVRRLLLLLTLIGPGIIAAAVGNDAGGITTYSVAGAHYGYNLLWVMIPITIALIMVQEMCGRMGVVSGKGLADLIREVYGAKITFYILVSLFIANIATVISEFAGVASSFEIFAVPRYVSVPVCAFAVWLLITKTNYRVAEKVFLVGALLYLAYIVSGYIAHPDWAEVGKAIITPRLEFSDDYIFLIIGLIGTTIAPWMQFYLQASVVEKGVKIEHYKYTRWDVIVGSILSNVVTLFIVIAAAATLYKAGIRINDAADAALALQPIAGEAASYLFAFGLLTASLLGATIVPIATSYYMCEGLGFESGVDKSFKEAPWFYGIFTFLIIAGAIPMLFPQVPLVKIMLVAQVINGVLLAPLLIFIVKLSSKEWLMGTYKNPRWYNAIAWIVVSALIMISSVLVWKTLF